MRLTVPYKSATFFTVLCSASLLIVTNAANAELSLDDFHRNPDPANTFPLGSVDFTEGGVPAGYFDMVDTMTSNLTGDFSGTVTSTVWMNAAGQLAFEYMIVNDSSSALPIRQSTIGGNWLNVNVFEVGSDGSGLSTGDWVDGDPTLIGREDALGAGAPTIFWDVGGPFTGTAILPGQFSASFWYATNATDFVIANFTTIEGGSTGSASAFSAVPAPSAVLLGVIGLGFVGWIRRVSS